MDEGTFSLPAAAGADATHVEIDESTLDALLDGICITPETEPSSSSSRRRARRVHCLSARSRESNAHPATELARMRTETRRGGRVGAQDSTISDVRVAAPESENTSLRGELARTRDALASLRARYHQIIEELHLLKRRLHVAKAERLDDVADAQLAFDRLTAEADALETVLEGAEGHTDAGAAAQPPPAGMARKKSSTKPTGHRKLSDCDLPEVRVEIPYPELEGKFERIGFDESSRVGFERGGRRRAVCARHSRTSAAHVCLVVAFTPPSLPPSTRSRKAALSCSAYTQSPARSRQPETHDDVVLARFVHQDHPHLLRAAVERDQTAGEVAQRVEKVGRDRHDGLLLVEAQGRHRPSGPG